MNKWKIDTPRDEVCNKYSSLSGFVRLTNSHEPLSPIFILSIKLLSNHQHCKIQCNNITNYVISDISNITNISDRTSLTDGRTWTDGLRDWTDRTDDGD